MFISGNKLRLYYWMTTRSGSGPCNLPEIEKGEYGYDLQSGQEVFALRYEHTNLECYFGCVIHEVTEEGLLMSSATPKERVLFIPWEKEFPIPAPKGPITKCNLYVEPCEMLFEKNKMTDILSGNIPKETWINDHLIKRDGVGIWYQHGGRRAPVSKYQGNLKNFIKLGQMELEVTGYV